MKRFGIKSLLGTTALVALIFADVFIPSGEICYTEFAVRISGRIKSDVKSDAIAVILNGNRHVRDSDLRHLASMPNLVAIDAKNSALTDACVSLIEFLPTVTEIDTAGSGVTKDGRRRLDSITDARRAKQLAELLQQSK